jgi:monoglucosyldiacylglycerol epimerase
MSMERLSGRRNPFAVTASYHAMHHVNPLGFYSSFLNVFDLIFGTAWAIRGKRIAVTGATGAFGKAMADRLDRLGGKVTRVGRDLAVELAETDILVLAHGAKVDGCWEANYQTPIEIGNAFIEAGRSRLVPPEIWGVGSETELYGFSDYAKSKQEFAAYVSSNWSNSPDVTYRHIVPAAFRSKMGWGLISADFAAAWALFLIRRGFSYVPVTYTTLALWNWFLYRLRGIALRPSQAV